MTCPSVNLCKNMSISRFTFESIWWKLRKRDRRNSTKILRKSISSPHEQSRSCLDGQIVRNSSTVHPSVSQASAEICSSWPSQDTVRLRQRVHGVGKPLRIGADPSRAANHILLNDKMPGVPSINSTYKHEGVGSHSEHQFLTSIYCSVFCALLWKRFLMSPILLTLSNEAWQRELVTERRRGRISGRRSDTSYGRWRRGMRQTL